jgi:hypothetical protein
MKNSLKFLAILFVVISAASCSADDMYETQENSIQLNDPSGGAGSNNDDRDWDKHQITNPGTGNNP